MKKLLKNKKRCLAAALMVVLSFAVSTGVTSAYLSKTPDNLTNVVTAGSVTISLVENAWNASNAENIHPLQSVKKDPSVRNTGKNDAWVFLEVSVPRKNINVVSTDTKRKTTKQLRDLYTFEPNTLYWDLIKDTVTATEHTYVYGYKETLKPGFLTPALFTSIKAVNYLEGELNANETLTVNVTAKAIQDNVVSDGTLSGIYNALLSQAAADAI